MSIEVEFNTVAYPEVLAGVLSLYFVNKKGCLLAANYGQELHCGATLPCFGRYD